MKKTVFTLFQKTMSLDHCIEQLKSMIPNLKVHIYTAHKQWKAHEVHIYTAHKQWKAHEILRSNLVPGSIITIEDYQMNLEVAYGEALTSVSYSANKIAVAIYPMCIEYLNNIGKLCEGGIVFISEDKLYASQLIEALEREAFDIMAQHIPYKFTDWKRFSARVQFWSGYVISNLFKMRKELVLDSISYKILS